MLFDEVSSEPIDVLQEPIKVLAKVGKANAVAQYLIFWDVILAGRQAADDNERLFWKLQYGPWLDHEVGKRWFGDFLLLDGEERRLNLARLCGIAEAQLNGLGLPYYAIGHRPRRGQDRSGLPRADPPAARRGRSRTPRHRHGGDRRSARLHRASLRGGRAQPGARGARPRCPGVRRDLPAVPAALRREAGRAPISKAPSTSSRRRCVRNTISRSCGTVQARSLYRWSPPITARSVSKTRRCSAKTISPRSPTAAPASKTACSFMYHYGVNCGSAFAQSLRGNDFHHARRASSACIRAKGEIAAGCDADLVVWDPARALHHQRRALITCGWITRCSKATK